MIFKIEDTHAKRIKARAYDNKTAKIIRDALENASKEDYDQPRFVIKKEKI